MDLDRRNEELNKKIDETDLPTAVAILVSDAHKRKRQLRLIVISIFLDLFLTLGLGYLSIQTHGIASQAENNKEALVQSCKTSNEARSNNKQIWDFLLNVQTPNTPTLQQKQVRDQFQSLVNNTFAPRDCNILK